MAIGMWGYTPVRITWISVCLSVDLALVVSVCDLLQDLAGYVNEVKRDNENMQLISDVAARFLYIALFLASHIYMSRVWALESGKQAGSVS